MYVKVIGPISNAIVERCAGMRAAIISSRAWATLYDFGAGGPTSRTRPFYNGLVLENQRDQHANYLWLIRNFAETVICSLKWWRLHIGLHDNPNLGCEHLRVAEVQ